MNERTPLTPDYIEHEWVPLQRARLEDGFVHCTWTDGTTFGAYSLWLAENAEGYGLEPTVRESMLEPVDYPSPDEAITGVAVDHHGGLVVHWHDGRTSNVHPGWLRHIADGRHVPPAWLPTVTTWTAHDLDEPPTVDGTDVLDDDRVIEAWLAGLVEYGLCRLANVPTDHDFLAELMARVGPIRTTNFGPIWSVRADPVPDSTANTGLDLGQHTDLPTREVPPGHQFLHCVENTVEGGWSRMSDGWAIVAAIEAEHPEAYLALTTLDWVFANRSPVEEHRWIGPLIDLGSGHRPITLRAFYPVRLAPHMHPAQIPGAYAAMQLFHEVARSDRFQITFPFRPGDIVGFDNRRVLHGRDAFESTGHRHLRGCYADHDDIYSRLRVLRRPRPASTN